jgi:hypothetical protein
LGPPLCCTVCHRAHHSTDFPAAALRAGDVIYPSVTNTALGKTMGIFNAFGTSESQGWLEALS